MMVHNKIRLAKIGFYVISLSSILKSLQRKYIEEESYTDYTASLDNWQTVPLSNGFNLYIYSAFYDDVQEDKPIIKIIAVGKKRQPPFNVTYTMFYSDFSASTSGSCTVKSILEWHPSYYRSKWIICNVTDDRVPSTIHIKGKVPSYAELKVYNPRRQGEKNTMNVCVRPLHKSFNDAAVLVEFIELYLMLGASHFTFYNQSMGPSVSKAIQYYRSKGIVTLLDFDLPVYSRTVADGQYTVLQDCFLRSRGVHQYVAMVDVDEFIFPRQHSTLQDVLAATEIPNVGAFYFASLTFCNSYQRNQSVRNFLETTAKEQNYFGDVPLKLQTQELTLRANKPCNIPDKSKVIVDPWKIDETTVHFVTKMGKGYARQYVNSSVAMIHHYRICSDMKWLGRCPAFPNPEVDVIAHQYLHALANRVLNVYHDVGF